MDFWTFALVAVLAAFATTALCVWVISHHNRKLFTAIKKFVVESLPEIRIKTEAYQKLRAEVLADGKALLDNYFQDLPQLAHLKTEAWSDLNVASRLFDGFDYRKLRSLGLSHTIWAGADLERLRAYEQKVDRLRDEIELIREASQICIE